MEANPNICACYWPIQIPSVAGSFNQDQPIKTRCRMILISLHSISYIDAFGLPHPSPNSYVYPHLLMKENCHFERARGGKEQGCEREAIS